MNNNNAPSSQNGHRGRISVSCNKIVTVAFEGMLQSCKIQNACYNILNREVYWTHNNVELSQKEKTILKEEQAMAFKIGFAAEHPENKSAEATYTVPQQAAPRKSVVQVHFAGRNMTLAYYNDQFDLHTGDMVYVDGKLEGQRGRVVEVNYNFKIRLSEYKRVIAVVDTNVTGQFFMAGSHFVTFDREALPANKVVTWFKTPTKGDEEFASGSDDTSFPLDDIKGMNVSAAIAERGHNYYMENRVRYISIDGIKGYALVEGSEVYEVEFVYRDGEISSLICSCFCSYNCKHEFAAMLQLRETLELIEKHYAAEYNHTGYFAAVNKGTLFAFAIDGRETGNFTL